MAQMQLIVQLEDHIGIVWAGNVMKYKLMIGANKLSILAASSYEIEVDKGGVSETDAQTTTFLKQVKINSVNDFWATSVKCDEYFYENLLVQCNKIGQIGSDQFFAKSWSLVAVPKLKIDLGSGSTGGQFRRSHKRSFHQLGDASLRCLC